MTPEQFLQVADALPEAALLLSCDGAVLAANRATRHRLGVPPEELRGRRLSDLVSEPVDTIADYLNACMHSGDVVCGAATLRHAGEQGVAYRCEGTRLASADAAEPAQILLRLVPQESVDGQFGVLNQQVEELAREISRRRQLEQDLMAEREQFRTLADSIPQLAWMARPDGFIFWYNRRWYDYTGTTPEQMQGWGWQTVHGPAELPRVLANWKAALARGEPWEDTFPLRRHDGVMRWHLSRAQPVRDAAGRVVRWFGTNTDITERMAMERALRDADRRKDEFLATLAHELRNPLAPIGNSLEVLRRARDDPALAAQARGMMERQMKQMVRLVDDLLDVSRINRGRIELRKERVELAAVVCAAVETSRPVIEAAEHRLTVELPDQPIVLEADPIRLAQVLASLLTNAARYTDRGGDIRLSAAVEAGQAVLRVRDNGVGIPADLLTRIFDLFTQVRDARGRSQGGLGVGLTIVRSLVELHGGSVTAASAGPGRGSEFVIRLPARPPPPSTAPAAAGGPAAAGAPRRILVVDDNEDAAESLALLLRVLGQEVRVAHDGPAALAAALDFRPDTAFLDLGMPGMDGYELARRLRAEPSLQGIRLAALTGWGQEDDRRRTRAAGFDLHLTKPAEMAVLQQLLARE